MRRIDHIVVAVRELDRAAEIYCRLGFQVGARNRHPWGTENRLIQFGSSFIELITVVSEARRMGSHQPHQFSFGAFVRDHLEEREGIAMLVLSSADARSDAARFAEQGIGDFEPFFFERKARKPDGSETQVAFTLAFAKDPAAPDLGFFVCQQHFPANFWNRSYQQHANLATDIAAVTLTAPAPQRHTKFLAEFTGAEKQFSRGGGFRFVVDGGRIELDPAAPRLSKNSTSPSLTSVSVRVNDIAELRRFLRKSSVPFTTSEDVVSVAPSFLSGVELRFE